MQKFPIPERSSDTYDRSKKHTLFAGTRVLSSGRKEEILAIVQTMDAHTTKGQLIQSILFPISLRFKYNEHLKYPKPSAMLNHRDKRVMPSSYHSKASEPGEETT
ncbi:unnamed protein product [Peronospora belbahrii]|uniref:Uncharacterized protein n=1 Tax=Peronospora belbahrii TaxID=622444 RepID=A0ABN8CKS3_9STRA|nr:unnamed protein product [Peronospora belbahrii]